LDQRLTALYVRWYWRRCNMGEKTQDLAEFEVSGKTILVELNHPVFEEGADIIHIQTDTMRFECSYGDFFSLATTILVAEKNLKIIKGLK